MQKISLIVIEQVDTSGIKSTGRAFTIVIVTLTEFSIPTWCTLTHETIRSADDKIKRTIKLYKIHYYYCLKQEHSESADLRQGSSIPGLSSKSTLKLSAYNFL